MTRGDQIAVVPVHWHGGRPYFVRLSEIPEPQRASFVAWLRGQACPALPGETAIAYAWDWQRFRDEWSLSD